MSALRFRLSLSGLLLLLIATVSLHTQPTTIVDATKLGTSPTIYLNTWRFHMGDSDGVVEAMNAAGDLYGFDQTRAISSQPAQAIADAAQTFGNLMPKADDITVLTVTRNGVAERRAA